jgi:hypothetical protein
MITPYYSALEEILTLTKAAGRDDQEIFGKFWILQCGYGAGTGRILH